MCRSIIAILYLNGHPFFATSSWSLISVPLTKIIEAITSVAFVGFSVQGLISRIIYASTPFYFQSKLLYFTSPEGKHNDTATLHQFKIVPVCLVQMGKPKLRLADLAAGFCSKTVTVCLISKGNGAFWMEVAISWDATISHHPGLPLLCRVSVATRLRGMLTRGREEGKCQITMFMNLLPCQCWHKKNQFHLHPISWQA